MVSALALEREKLKPPNEPIDSSPIERESGFKNEILILISAPLLDSNEQPVVALSVQREVDEIYDALADLDLDLEIVVKVVTAKTLNELGDHGICHSARVTILVAKYWRSVAPGGDPLVGIDRALAAADRCRDQLAIADLHKVKGDRLLIQQGLSVAQKSYAKAIDLYGSIRQNSLPILEKAQIQQKLGAVWEAYPSSEQAEIFYFRAFELYEVAET